MNQLQVFQNNEFGQIRTIDIEGQTWFIANEVAEKLGYTNPSKATNDHCKNSQMWWGNDSLGRNQRFKIIPESDLYRLIIKSTLPSAERFEKWVMEEVLPSIRKTGQYQVSNYPPKASSIGEIVQLGRFIKQLMKEQDATPYQIAEVVLDTMKQFGINLNDKMLLPVRLEKVKDDELDMVEFACAFPSSTYQDYLLYRTMIKVSR